MIQKLMMLLNASLYVYGLLNMLCSFTEGTGFDFCYKSCKIHWESSKSNV